MKKAACDLPSHKNLEATDRRPRTDKLMRIECLNPAP